jgi:hypothetical protein
VEWRHRDLETVNLPVAAAAETLGLDVEVRAFRQGTRTADDAAAAIGCAVAQIVKSLVFVTTRRSGSERATRAAPTDITPAMVGRPYSRETSSHGTASTERGAR